MCFSSYVSVFLLSTQEVITWLTQLGVGPTWQQKCWERLSPLKYLTMRYTDTHTSSLSLPVTATVAHIYIFPHEYKCAPSLYHHTHTHAWKRKHTLLCPLSAESLHLIKDGCPISIKGFVYRWAGQVAVLTIPLCLLWWTQTPLILIFYASSGWTLLEEV